MWDSDQTSKSPLADKMEELEVLPHLGMLVVFSSAFVLSVPLCMSIWMAVMSSL